MNNQVTETAPATRRRIALAVGTEGMGTLLPMVLKALASEEPAEISGTFMWEDQNLLNLAALPVFKEVCPREPGDHSPPTTRPGSAVAGCAPMLCGPRF